MTKRILTALLAVMLVVSMVLSLVACDSGKKDNDDNEAAGTPSVSDGVSNDDASNDDASNDDASNDEASNDSSSDVPDEVDPIDPDNTINFQNKVVTFLGRNSGENSYITYQVDCETPSEDPVINAFCLRNALIKEQYGLDIDVAYPDYGEDIITKFRMDIMSGDPQYHGIVSSINYLAPLAADGILKDFNSIDNGYVDLTAEYWDQALIRDLKLKDKVFFLSGDALVQDDQNTWCMYFNRNVIEEYGLENPYELVRNDEWTIDKMYEMAQEYELTNGAVKSYKPEVGDKWGMVVQSYDFYQFMLGANQPMVDNSGDVPTLRIDDPLNYDTFNKIASFFIYDNVNIGVADYHGNWDSGVYEDEVKIFANGNALFMPNNIATASSAIMRASDVEFGIIPMPKRDKDQADYVSGINAYQFDVIALPHNLQGEELDAASFALEAMAYYGKEYVTPAYYDNAICQKSLQDSDSVEMLDIILCNRVFDMGSAFNFNDGYEHEGTLYFYTDFVGERSDAIASHYEERKAGFQAGIDKLLAQCEENLN